MALPEAVDDRPASRADVQLPAPAQVLAELAEAFPSRPDGAGVRRMVRWLRRRAGWTRQDYRRLWSRPEKSFGPFGALPAPVREALADAVTEEMRERSFISGERMHRRVYGPVFRLGSELCLRGRRISGRGRRWRRPGRWIYLCGRGICRASEQAGRGWLAVTRFGGSWPRSGFHALWKWAGVDPVRAGIEYVRNVPCDPRISPVYRDPARRVCSWIMVGFDLMPSDGDVYYIESNINPGFFSNRRQVNHADGDPLLEAMIEGARREGCDRIVLYPSSVAAPSRQLEDWWREQTSAAGLELEIRDDPHARSRYRRETEPIMALDAERTLFVNIRTLPHPVNVLLEEKGLFEAEIERHNADAPESERIAVPRVIRSADEILPLEPAGRFPNLVVKHALLNEARDVRMYRAATLRPDLFDPPYVAYEFVPPELEDLEENGVEGEYAVKYRLNTFITPDGPLCTYASKGVGAVPVPDTLADGPVTDPRPYVVNNHMGGRHASSTREEFERVAPTAMRLGWLAHDFLRRLHGPKWPNVESRPEP
jgi:hypothetical protein